MAAVDYLSGRPDVTDGRIGALGMSMGAEEAIGAAGADPRIRAVIAEGASGRGPADEGAELAGVGRWLMPYIDWTTTHAADLMTSAHRPTKLVDAVSQAAPRPVLVIAAGDAPVEIDAANAFQAAAPESVELWIVPDTGHTKGYDTHPVEWEARVVEFLDASLAR
jgi:dienelactone hydrolase